MPRLTQEEQKVFGFIRTHQPLIAELAHIIGWINPLLKTIKTNGASQDICTEEIARLNEIEQSAQTEREKKLLARVKSYLENVKAILPAKQDTYHASSDIIESCFGLFKYRQSPNKHNGVTSSVLLLSLRTRAHPESLLLDLDVKQAFETHTIGHIAKWQQANLSENQVRKRVKTLKK